METKTIRFEKGEKYLTRELPTYMHDYLPYRSLMKQEYVSDGVWTCLKSFTVQINIIEDDSK